MNNNGHKITTLYMTGGNAKNALFVKEHADITGCKVVRIISFVSPIVIIFAGAC